MFLAIKICNVCMQVDFPNDVNGIFETKAKMHAFCGLSMTSAVLKEESVSN